MSLASPPPPPPPPPPTPPVTSPQSTSEDDCYEPIPEGADAWKDSVHLSLIHLPAWKASCEDPNSEWIWIVCNKGVSSIIQKREQPVCGLLALGMASQMMSSPWKDIWDVVDVAKQQGFTRYGEMFSARWLLQLAKAEYNMEGDILNGNLLHKTDILINHLAKGWPLLIAYDTDSNFEPCCKKGHKAHWAVLTGFLYKVSRDQLSEASRNSLQQDQQISSLYHLPNTVRDITEFQLPTKSPEDIFIIAKQGKSRRYGVWSYLNLCESNGNLEELSPTREADERNYVIPDIGVGGGLANQAIMLRPALLEHS